jgi:hypothetical protein
MPDYVGSGEAARLTGARSSKSITDLFWMGDLREDLCPIIGGRRMIPRTYLPEVKTALKKRNWLRAEAVAIV